MFWFGKKNKKSLKEQNEHEQYGNTAISSELSITNEKTVLHFDNLNFKLAVVEVLMYEMELLKPAFNIFDFADEHAEEEIDTESMEIVEPALTFFKELQIPASLAPYVESIYMDGGNEVYMNIIPQ